MRVMSFITKLDYSGGPKMLAWVTNQIAMAGHDVHLVSIYGDKVEREMEPGVTIHFMNLEQSQNRFYRNTIEVIKDVLAIQKIVNEIKPDLILSFIYSIDVYYLVYSKLFKRNNTKFLMSMRLDPYSQKTINDRVRNALITLADGFVFQTEGAKKYYSGSVQNRSVVIPNPVTEKTIRYASGVKGFQQREDFVVLPARLYVHQKRQDIAIKAFKRLYLKHPNLRLILLGNGPDCEMLKRMIVEEGLENHVVIHDAVENAEEFVGKCKIMILTSDFEGIPNSLIEAMAIGLPVVATDCSPGGARELITDGKNGFLVKCGDYEKLAEKIDVLIQDTMLAEKIGANAKLIVADYSEDRISQQWTRFINRILEDRH